MKLYENPFLSLTDLKCYAESKGNWGLPMHFFARKSRFFRFLYFATYTLKRLDVYSLRLRRFVVISGDSSIPL